MLHFYLFDTLKLLAYIHKREEEKGKEIYKIIVDDFHIKYVCMFLYKEQLITKECQEVLPEQ